VPIVLKSRNLSLLETSGAVQACNGIAVLLPSYVKGMVAKMVQLQEVVA